MFNEVKRKAAVGERIKIVKPIIAVGYEHGDEGTVMSVEQDGIRANLNGRTKSLFHAEYVVLEPVISTEQSAELELPEELAQTFAQFIRENAATVRKYLDQFETKPFAPIAPTGPIAPTAVKPLTRAQVIEKARKDVAELGGAVRDGRGRRLGVSGGNADRSMNVVAHVNRKKRAVTVILRGRYSGKVWAKGIAKCAPGDVFHAEIGKAIAVRKALGLTIPTEYTDAPQPDEPQAGAVVRKTGERHAGETRTITEKHNDICRAYWFTNRRWSSVEYFEIIDDTDVDYGASAKEVA